MFSVKKFSLMTIKKKIYLWPDPQTPSLGDMLHRTSTHKIENLLHSYWPEIFPVLFSSARSGLTAILQHLGLTRPDLVWCPPYSSHCLFESIARISTPITEYSDKVQAALIYHQWGFSCSHQWPESVTIIEDSVDTLFIPKAEIFSNNGRFAFQSLPKVYGCVCGGIVFCRSEEDAQHLKNIRKQRGISKVQTLLRMISPRARIAYLYWHGAESLHGSLPNLVLNQIYRKVKKLPRLVKERLDFLNELTPSLAEHAERTGRIPSNLPLVVTPDIKEMWNSDKVFSSGLRNFNINRTAPDVIWKSVAPLPLHIDVVNDDLYRILPLLKNKIKSEVIDELDFF
jgi:putative PLP-dependent aminotransferase (TIGR04422 family)